MKNILKYSKRQYIVITHLWDKAQSPSNKNATWMLLNVYLFIRNITLQYYINYNT